MIDHEGQPLSGEELTEDLVNKSVPWHLRQRVDPQLLKGDILRTMKSMNERLNNKLPDIPERPFLSRLMDGPTKKEKERKKRITEIITNLQIEYIEYLALNVEMYGTSFFNVYVIEPEWREYTLSSMVQFAVNRENLYLCNERNRILHKYGLHHVENVMCFEEQNEIRFEIKADSEGEEATKYRLQTEKVDQMVSALSECILRHRQEHF